MSLSFPGSRGYLHSSTLDLLPLYSKPEILGQVLLDHIALIFVSHISLSL